MGTVRLRPLVLPPGAQMAASINWGPYCGCPGPKNFLLFGVQINAPDSWKLPDGFQQAAAKRKIETKCIRGFRKLGPKMQLLMQYVWINLYLYACIYTYATYVTSICILAYVHMYIHMANVYVYSCVYMHLCLQLYLYLHLFLYM